MHSLGNDIIILPQEISLCNEELKRMAHRNYGIGCDQIMALGAHIRIWNQDGTLALACGNGTRCVIDYLNPPYDEKITLNGPVGPLTGWKSTDGLVYVQQGVPLIGTIVHKGGATAVDTLDLSAYGYDHGIPVSIGNPHLVISARAPSPDSPVWKALSGHPAFPEGVNVSFVYEDGTEICVTTWERGAGLTLGCGSAACAVAYVLFQRPSFIVDFSPTSSGTPLSLRMPGGKIVVYETDQGMVHGAPTSTICWGWWKDRASKDMPPSDLF